MIQESMKTFAKAMIEEELERAIKERGMFNSLHEAWAVMKEECDELYSEVELIELNVSFAWESVKDDDVENIVFEFDELKRRAVLAICEATQVGAMAEKMLKYIGMNREIMDKAFDDTLVDEDGNDKFPAELIDDIEEIFLGEEGDKSCD